MEIEVAECPLGAKCEEVVTRNGKQIMKRCPWYTEVRGHNSNTGKETHEWGCAIAWMPTLMINTANESRKSVAAIESFRNVMAEESQKTRQLLSLVPSDKLTLVNKDEQR